MSVTLTEREPRTRCRPRPTPTAMPPPSAPKSAMAGSPAISVAPMPTSIVWVSVIGSRPGSRRRPSAPTKSPVTASRMMLENDVHDGRIACRRAAQTHPEQYRRLRFRYRTSGYGKRMATNEKLIHAAPDRSSPSWRTRSHTPTGSSARTRSASTTRAGRRGAPPSTTGQVADRQGHELGGRGGDRSAAGA